jgi:hypothetical protein
MTASSTLLILVDDVDHCITSREATRGERLAAHLHATRLDHALVAGASPDASAELALRGRTLVQPCERRALAKSVRRLIREAYRPVPRFSRSGSPIRRERVRGAARDLQALIDLLLAPAPVSARGVAHVTVLLTDGAGPLYHPGSVEDLQSEVRRAAAALDPLNDWLDPFSGW